MVIVGLVSQASETWDIERGRIDTLPAELAEELLKTGRVRLAREEERPRLAAEDPVDDSAR